MYNFRKSTTKPDIIFGTETWLTSNVYDAEIFPPELGYNVFRKDRDDGYGGVFVATKNSLIAHEVNKENHVEAVFVKIKLTHGLLTVGSVYRTPTHSTQEQMKAIVTCLDKLNTNDVLWIGGDMNLPDIDWKHEKIVRHQYPISINETFIDKIRDLGLSQMNHTPTRDTNILDIFLTNRPNLVTNCFTIPGLSDHDILITDSNIKTNKVVQTRHTVTIWKKANIDAMIKETEQFSTELLNETELVDVENMWASIQQHLKNMISKHIPTKQKSLKYHQPWITTKLKRLARQKQRAWTKAKSTKLLKHKEKYKSLKKQTRCENRKAYSEYVRELTEEDSDKKQLWKFVKYKKRDPVGVAPLIEDGVVHSDNKDKANLLNKQFCSVFVSEDNSHIPTPTHN